MCAVAVAVAGWAVPAGAQDPGGRDADAPEHGAADLAAGEALYQSVCRNCHGPEAKGMASFPGLAGQDAEHLAGQLEAYRAGRTLGPNTALMAPHAKELSDADIANLAASIAAGFD